MKIQELSAFGISHNIVERLLELGIVELTEVQRLAVQSGLFSDKNIVVSSPTNTGKTFIGELSSLAVSTRRTKNKSFFLFPLKALAEEKFEEFKRKYSDWGIGIAITSRDRTEYDKELENYDLIIATYEKLNSLLIRRPKLLDELGLVVIDELQNIGDKQRGATLEMLLTLLLTSNSPKIIGLSATIPNAADIAKWLGAILVKTDKREIELREGIVNSGSKPVKFQEYNIQPGDSIYREFNSGKVGIEPGIRLDEIEDLAKRSLQEQTIVFVKTQPKSEEIARRIADESPESNETAKLIQELEDNVEATPSTRTLKRTLQNGVAFHHAGLLPEERALIEDGFRAQEIRIICATPTLEAGVNTPAKNVVFQTYENYEGKNISTRTYKNMSGRAGRIKKKDDFGRSILFASTMREFEILWNGYIIADSEPVKSQIADAWKLNTSTLGLVATGVCVTITDLLTFMKATFFGYSYYHSSSGSLNDAFETSLRKEIELLKKDGFIQVDVDHLVITQLGRVCAEELLSPKTISLFYKTLKQKSKELTASELNGLIEALIHLAVCSTDGLSSLVYPPKSEAEKQELQAVYEKNKEKYLYLPSDRTNFLEQFRTTRMLFRWIEGVSYNDLRQYGTQGKIKRSADIISWIVNGMAHLVEKAFEEEPNKDLHSYLYELAEQLFYGVPVDAVPVMKMRIAGISRNRAIQLSNAGFKTIEDLIRASPDQLQKAKGIGPDLSLRIKAYAEGHIKSEIARIQQSQTRRAKELGRDPSLLRRLYFELGDNFVRVFVDIMKEMKITASYIGDIGENEPDALVTTKDGKIVIEGKRKENGNVTAKEAQEILGKGARHKPIVYVTIGYPDFVEEAKKNAKHAKTTLLRADLIGECLLSYWQGKFTDKDMISLLKSGDCINSIKEEPVKKKSILD